MLFRFSIKQVIRTPIKSFMIMLIIACVCSFLVIGINLYFTTQEEIKKIHSYFDIAAFPEFKANINKNGMLASPNDNDYIGYLSCAAKNYDWSQVLELPGVETIHTWNQFGAYISQVEPVANNTIYCEVFVMTYLGETPILLGENAIEFAPDELIINWHEEWGNTNVSVQSLSWNEFYYHNKTITEAAKEIDAESSVYVFNELENDTLSGIWLKPGQQYIGIGTCVTKTQKVADGVRKVAECYINEVDAHQINLWQYKRDGSIGQKIQSLSSKYPEAKGFYPSFLPFDEEFWRTPAGDYVRDTQEFYYRNRRLVAVAATDNISFIKPFFLENVYISQGRTFTAEEYTDGSKVCVVSEILAEHNGWEVGDQINLSFFDAEYAVTNGCVDAVRTWYQCWEPVIGEDGESRIRLVDKYFYQNSYTIIGVYAGAVTDPTKAGREYSLDEGLCSTLVIVPKSAVENIPGQDADQFHTIIMLSGEMVNSFMEAIQASGLQESQVGGYQLDITVYDQGLSNFIKSLEQMKRISVIILFLACVFSLFVIVAISVLTCQQNKRQIAFLRLLGMNHKQISIALLSGAVIVYIIGACVGNLMGFFMSQEIGQYITETSQSNVGDSAFSAMIAETTEPPTFNIAITTRPIYNIVSTGMIVSLIMIVIQVFLKKETKKPPIMQINEKE